MRAQGVSGVDIFWTLKVVHLPTTWLYSRRRVLTQEVELEVGERRYKKLRAVEAEKLKNSGLKVKGRII